jgi:hypothetical protein
MKLLALPFAVLALGLAAPLEAAANCADDAVDTCNQKHPDPNKSKGAYQKYELCIKAQLGQKCPPNAPAGLGLLANLEEGRDGIAPACPHGYDLRVNWSGREDRCVSSTPGAPATPQRTLKVQ